MRPGLLLSTLLTFFCGTSFSAIAEKAILQKSTFEEDAQSYRLLLEFDRPPQLEISSIEWINKTIQVNLPKATVKSGKESQKVNDSAVSSLYIYQYQPDLLRARVIFDAIDAERFKDQVFLAARGNVAEIKISKQVASNFRADRKPPQGLNEEPDFEAELLALGGIDNTGGAENHSPTTGGLIKSQSPKDESEIPISFSEKSSPEKPTNLWLRLLWSLGVLAAMAAGLVLFGRRFAKPAAKVGGPIKIEVMAQHSLGPKRNLTVISVAGEALLIGVTENHISLIKSLALIDDEMPEVASAPFNQQLNFKEDEELGLPEKKVLFQDDLFAIKDKISSRIKEMRPL